MKTKLIAFFSIAITMSMLMISNNSQSSTNSKICKHNGIPYAIIPMQQLCVHSHSSTHSSSNPTLTTSQPAFNRSLINHDLNKESHICVLTEEPLSGL